MITSAFQKVTVEEIAAPSDGSIAIGPFGSSMKSSLYTPSGVPVIRGNNIGSGRNTVGDFVFVSEETADRLKRSQLVVGDLFFPHRGAIGEVGIVRQSDPQPALMSTSLMRLRVDTSKADPEFVFWFFKSAIGRHEILLYASTVGTPGIGQPLTSLRSMKLPLPTLEEQQQIAAVLNALDDKIELNRRMSATLEEMARALYRSWFVDFDPVHARALGQSPPHIDPTTAALFPDSFGPDGLPKGWEAGTLSDIASNIRRQVQPGNIEADTPYIGLEHMPRRSIALPDWGKAGQVGSAKSAMRRGQTLFGKLRPYFHKVGIVPTDGICSTDILVIDAKADSWREMILNIVSSDDFVEHANATSSGTRMPRSNWKDMARFDIVIPPEKVVEAFSSIVRPMTEKIVAGIHEVHTLAALRDALLPRLMSGELRIREAEKEIEELV